MHWPFRAPGGDRTFNAAMFLGIGLWFWGVQGLLRGDPVSSVMGAPLLLLGLGLWFWYSRVRWPAAILLVAIVGFNLIMMARKEFSWTPVVVALGTLWVAWGVVRDQGHQTEEERPAEVEENPQVSIVLLLREPRHLEVAILAKQISRAWGAEYVGRESDASAPPENATPDGRVVVGATPLFAAMAPDGIYLVHNRSTPYLEEVEKAASTVPEPRAREAVLRHRAWIAVDLSVPRAPAGPVESYYRPIGRLIAELADDDCLAAFHPASMRMCAWDPAIEDLLRGPEPLQAFTVPESLGLVRRGGLEPTTR